MNNKQNVKDDIIEYFPNNDWYCLLKNEFDKPYFIELQQKLQNEYNQYRVYPERDELFKAFNLSSFNNTRVVIFGQDPYHQPNQANGLSFSVAKGAIIPKSLNNIYKELKNDLNVKIPPHGSLEDWGKQGVLLLNAFLTVRSNSPASHRTIGWERFTNTVISLLNEKKEPIVYILWGKFAEKKAALITNPHHLCIISPHPSPLSAYRGFFNSYPFSRTNDFLSKHAQCKIDWEIK